MGAENQEKSLVNEKKKDDRQRAYAFLVYEDSSNPDWLERLNQEHVEALVSPYHDRDFNPDGTPKKPHWHVMLMYDGKKSRAQINELRERVIGPDYNRKFEEIGTMRGYARYMCHMDNPEKAEYDKADVVALCGVDYDAIITLPGDDDRMIGDMMEYIREHEVRYYSDFMLMCKANNQDWFKLLVSRRSYVIIEFIKSEAAKAMHAEREAEREARHTVDYIMGRRLAKGVDPATGEVLEGADDVDSQD